MAGNFLNVPASNIKQEPLDNSLSPRLSPSPNNFSVSPTYQPISPNPIGQQQQQHQNYPNFPQFIASPTTHTAYDPQPLLIGENNFNIQPDVIRQKAIDALHVHQFTSNANVTMADPDIANLDTGTANLSSLLDIDSQQLTYINSTDLAGISLSLLDGAYQLQTIGGVTVATTTAAPTTITNNFNGIDRTSDIMADPDENMTDSFTRLQLDEMAATINKQ